MAAASAAVFAAAAAAAGYTLMRRAAAAKETKPAEPEVRVLVTGGSGLVGKGIQAALEKERAEGEARGERWIFLSSKEGDLRDRKATYAIFKKYKPTHVVHLAAFVGGLFANLRYKVEFYRYNILMNDNVMEACREFGVTKLVSCLSTCIFPDKTTYPINEDMLHNGAPHHSNEGYAYAKRLIDVQNRSYKAEYGCNFTSVIPTNIYGPYDNFHLKNAHVIPALIHKCYLAMRDGTDFVVLGSGRPLRQFIHSHDLGALVVWTLRHYDSVDPIILSVGGGPDEEVPIRRVAEAIADAFGLPRDRMKFDAKGSDGQMRKTADNTKLMGLRPDYRFIGIEEGIKSTVEWFKEAYAAGTVRV